MVEGDMTRILVATLLGTSLPLACTPAEVSIKQARENADALVRSLGYADCTFEGADTSPKNSIWFFIYQKGGRRLEAVVDKSDGTAYAMHTEGLKSSLEGSGQVPGWPALTPAAIKEKATQICDRLGKGVTYRLNAPDRPAAMWPAKKGSLGTYYRIGADVYYNGTQVYGYGCSLELNCYDGSVISYAGKWVFPTPPPIPAHPLTLDQAVRAAQRYSDSRNYPPRKTPMPLPKEPKLYYVDHEGRMRYAWDLIYYGSRYTVDAATGEVFNYEVYKRSTPSRALAGKPPKKGGG